MITARTVICEWREQEIGRYRIEVDAVAAAHRGAVVGAQIYFSAAKDCLRAAGLTEAMLKAVTYRIES